MLDDISEASVTIPDRFGGVRCCAPFGGLVPWRFGLRIERDSQLVWDGPVVTIRRDPGDVSSITVAANDQLARFRKRFAALESQNYTNLDAGEIFSAIIAGTALRSPERVGVPHPRGPRRLSVTREVVARDFELAYDLISELFESALDGYVLAGDLVLYEPGSGWFYHDGYNAHTRLEGPYDQFPVSWSTACSPMRRGRMQPAGRCRGGTRPTRSTSPGPIPASRGSGGSGRRRTRPGLPGRRVGDGRPAYVAQDG